jgi:hypothetical protein
MIVTVEHTVLLCERHRSRRRQKDSRAVVWVRVSFAELRDVQRRLGLGIAADDQPIDGSADAQRVRLWHRRTGPVHGERVRRRGELRRWHGLVARIDDQPRGTLVVAHFLGLEPAARHVRRAHAHEIASAEAQFGLRTTTHGEIEVEVEGKFDPGAFAVS